MAQRARWGLACTGKRFFVTVNGYMGLAQPEIKRGDSVCVFFGTNTPFVVRREGGHFLLIGEAYIQGLMSGEGIVHLQNGKVKVSDIELR
ncbi:hypothetical protein BGZ60DRAFT_389466 [Tricladium varicosporioides]|nr:hypothetical protein BGZ60DRAFT_389466 [Hymenoscyphus varicosporioides]